MKKKLFIIGFVVIATVFVVVPLLLIEAEWNIVRTLWDSYIFDNQISYLPCQDLPTLDTVEKTLIEHDQEIKDLKLIDGVEAVTIGDWRGKDCGNRAKIVITYSSHQARIAVEKFIHADTFFGIPYDLVNI